MSNEDKAPAPESAPRPDPEQANGAKRGVETSQAQGKAGESTAEEEQAVTESVMEKPARRDGLSRFLGLLALLVALAAAAGSGFLYWQYRQFYVALDDADESAQRSLERVRAELRSMRDDLEDVRGDQQAVGRALTDQEGEIASLPPRLVEIEERLTALQGVSADARRRWLRAETAYLLGVANAELQLAGRFESAIAALELADRKLRELGNPSLTPVREAIADDLQRLRAVALPDVEGLSLAIGSLAERVEQLPLASRPPDVYDPRGDEPDDLEPGLQRAWASLKSALKGMISVERRDVPVSRQLSVADEGLVRRTLELELSAARLALLRGRAQPYQQSLGIVRDYLSRYFDNADAQVAGALTLLDELVDIDVAPSRPDISASLNLLRELEAQQDPGP